jgi:hypothetical protein
VSIYNDNNVNTELNVVALKLDNCCHVELSKSHIYIGDVKRNVTRDNANDGDKQQSPLYLSWPPWAMRHK